MLRITGEIYGCAVSAVFLQLSPATRDALGLPSWCRVSTSRRTPGSSITAAASSGSTTGSPGPCRMSYRSSNTDWLNTGRRPHRPWTWADPGKPGALGADAPRWNPAAPWATFASPNNHALAGTDEDRPGQWNRLELVCTRTTACTSSMARSSWRSRMPFKDGDKWVPMTGGTLRPRARRPKCSTGISRFTRWPPCGGVRRLLRLKNGDMENGDVIIFQDRKIGMSPFSIFRVGRGA